LRIGEIKVFRVVRAVIGLSRRAHVASALPLIAPLAVAPLAVAPLGVGLLVLAPATMPSALAQTNIDQGKPASELFANYCAVCHKSTRGLANGRSGPALSQFLREHYAASREQAALLTAYVISAGGNAPPPKPERAKTEEPKNQEPKTQESKAQGKPRSTSSASAKPEPDKPGRVPPQWHEETTPGEKSETTPVVAATPPAAPNPAAPAAPANPAEAPTPELNPMAGASAEVPSGDNAPVPRDNIPD